MTKGESLRNNHLIIARWARSIIIIISTIRRVLCRLRRGRRRKTTKMRLSVSNATNFGVHLTHLIRKMVKMTTKISPHVLKLIHNGRKRCLYFRRGRWSRRWIGSRGIGSIPRSMKSTSPVVWKATSFCWAKVGSTIGCLAASYASLLIYSFLIAPIE